MNTPTLIRRYVIIGARRWGNYAWATLLSLGSLGFLMAGLASYTHRSDLLFFPQGLLMCFYGSLGLLVSLYAWLLIVWNVGAGFNEINKRDGSVRIFRWGYPGKYRRIDVSYSLVDIQAIRVEIKQGWDPQRTLYLKLKGKPDLPWTGVSQPLTLKEMEKQASELANFLQVSLEGLSVRSLPSPSQIFDLWLLSPSPTDKSSICGRRFGATFCHKTLFCVNLSQNIVLCRL